MADPCLWSAYFSLMSSQLMTWPKAALNSFRDAWCNSHPGLPLPSLSKMALKFFVKADLRAHTGRQLHAMRS